MKTKLTMIAIATMLLSGCTTADLQATNRVLEAFNQGSQQGMPASSYSTSYPAVSQGYQPLGYLSSPRYYRSRSSRFDYSDSSWQQSARCLASTNDNCR